jgi:hypothetical protein
MVLDTSRRIGKSKMKVLRTMRCYLTLFRDRGAWHAKALAYSGSTREKPVPAAAHL